MSVKPKPNKPPSKPKPLSDEQRLAEIRAKFLCGNMAAYEILRLEKRIAELEEQCATAS